MRNKLWIAALGVSAFVFAALALGGGFQMWVDHEPILRALPRVLAMGVFAWRATDMMISRIKYGPAGPPPAAREDSHVDL